MTHGGARKGAGRPRGAATKRSRKIADRESRNGITPLEVMLKAMRVHAENEDWDTASAFAKDAAPYMHPKFASVQHTGPNGGPVKIDLTNLPPDEIERLISLFGHLASVTDDDVEDASGGEG